jgi:hypothetical protein
LSTLLTASLDAHAIALAQLKERRHPLKWSFSSLEEGKIEMPTGRKIFLTRFSKRAEGVPAFSLPLFSLRFLTKSFLLQIYWIKPCTFREVRMNYLRRFSLRYRGSHGSSSLPALRPVSLHFLSFATFFTNTDIFEMDARESS